MTTNRLPTASMTSFRKTALAGGLLYLLTFISSIPAAILVGPLIGNPSYVTSSGADQQVAFGLVLEFVNALSCFGCAVALFSVIKLQHEGLAIGYVTTRMFEACVIAFGVVSLLAVISLRQQGAAGGDAAALEPAGHALIELRYWAMVIGPNMAAFNALMLGTALLRARLVPRGIPALGIFGAPIMVAYVIGTILGVTGPGTVFQAVAVAPFFIWELVLGLWLTLKGFSKSSPIAIAEQLGLDAQAPTLAQGAVAAKAGAA